MARRATSTLTRHERSVGGGDPQRLHALGTAVTAVTAGVLLVELIVPRPGQDVWAALARQLPTFATFATTFVLVVALWLRFGSPLARATLLDGPSLVLATLLLLGIAALAFPTALLGRALAVDAFARSAAVVYAATTAATCACGAALVVRLDRRARPGSARSRTDAAAVAGGVLCVVLAILDARLGLGACAVLAAGLLLLPRAVDEV